MVLYTASGVQILFILDRTVHTNIFYCQFWPHIFTIPIGYQHIFLWCHPGSNLDRDDLMFFLCDSRATNIFILTNICKSREQLTVNAWMYIAPTNHWISNKWHDAKPPPCGVGPLAAARAPLSSVINLPRFSTRWQGQYFQNVRGGTRRADFFFKDVQKEWGCNPISNPRLLTSEVWPNNY
jgi:hypothetical protein